MKHIALYIATAITFLTTACLPTPPPELLATRTQQPSVTSPNMTTDADAPPSARTSVEIGGRIVSVDEVIHGILCDDTWDGIIFVADDIQVNPWVDEPIFLRECTLVVSPGTIVYVAAHPGELFYRGCMCHE